MGAATTPPPAATLRRIERASGRAGHRRAWRGWTRAALVPRDAGRPAVLGDARRPGRHRRRSSSGSAPPSGALRLTGEVFGAAPRSWPVGHACSRPSSSSGRRSTVVEEQVPSLAAAGEEARAARGDAAVQPARSPSPPPRCTPARPRPAARGTPGWRRWWSTRWCAATSTTALAQPGRRAGLGGRDAGRGASVGHAAGGRSAPILDAVQRGRPGARRRRARRGARRPAGRGPRRRRPTRSRRPRAAARPVRRGPVVIGPAVPTWTRPARVGPGRAGRAAGGARPGRAPRGRCTPTTCCRSARSPVTPRPAARARRDVYRPLVAAGGGPARDRWPPSWSAAARWRATARALFVHPNTVRYRLRRVTEVCGGPPTDPAGPFTLQWRSAWAGCEARRDRRQPGRTRHRPQTSRADCPPISCGDHRTPKLS